MSDLEPDAMMGQAFEGLGRNMSMFSWGTDVNQRARTNYVRLLQQCLVAQLVKNLPALQEIPV